MVGLSIKTRKVVVRDSFHSIVLLGKHLSFLEQLPTKLEVTLLKMPHAEYVADNADLVVNFRKQVSLAKVLLDHDLRFIQLLKRIYVLVAIFQPNAFIQHSTNLVFQLFRHTLIKNE